MYSFTSINHYISDFINLLFLVIFFSLIIIYFNEKKIIISKNLFLNKKIQTEIFCISLLLIVPFFFNNFLIDWYYFPDQSKYLNATKIVRNLQLPEKNYMGVFSSSLFFGVFPIPFINTFISIALINKFIFLFAVYFIYKKKIISNYETLILLIVPSMLVYTSVALKESLIYFFSFIIFYAIREKNFLFLIFCFFILFFISKKFFLISVPVTTLFIIFFLIYEKNEIRLRIILLTLLFAVILFINFDSQIINFFDKLKLGYWSEQSRNSDILLLYDGYEKFSYNKFFSNIFYFFYKSLFGFININNPVNLKNLFIFFFYLFEIITFCFLFISFINKNYKKNILEILYCLIVLFIIISFFGYILENFNTLSRYKTQILVYLYLLLLSKKNK